MELIEFDRKALLAEAYQRVARKREVKRAVEQGGSVKAEVEHCLAEAFRCVDILCEPAGAIREVSAEVVDDGVLLGQGTVIHSTRMRDQITEGAKVYIYLLTCGYDSQKAFQWLDNDYSLYHFQNMIGGELLFSIGRHLHRRVCAGYPDYRFARYAVKMQNQCAEDGVAEAISLTPDYWDAGKVRSLLNLFGDKTLGISTTDAGCFAPVHALLGVMMGVPDAARA